MANAARGGTATLPERHDVAKLNIPVSGMTCAACQARVQRVLERTPGVEEATVSLMTNTAAVRFDPAVVGASTLVDRIRGTGYGAELPMDETSAVEEQRAVVIGRREMTVLRGELDQLGDAIAIDAVRDVGLA